MTEVPTEPEPEASDNALPVALAKGSRRSFTAIRRELSEDDLKSPAVQKMLLDDTDRLDEELKEAKGFRERFHDADKQRAILQEKLKTHTGFEVMSSGCLAVGGAAFGYAPNIWAAQQTTSIILLLIAAIVTLAGLWAKVLRA
ncbi:hypothetical protein LB542_06470 [Mesorhizobium sp. BR1-1-9]|uniref:hypothetical protein n=1 Tax=Mesorhizobium sp. BR1-1-9 TaxID=2876646 RepID=UPI001CD18B07|nr:hypothetical protein [Mesorhizobium sp. BR1-1-9]MBZ9870499.1 hypothetical protein [Mesorhizobium sp. BR1-1-9]